MGFILLFSNRLCSFVDILQEKSCDFKIVNLFALDTAVAC